MGRSYAFKILAVIPTKKRPSESLGVGGRTILDKGVSSGSWVDSTQSRNFLRPL